MSELSHSEENYLKEIFHLGNKSQGNVSTNSLAEKLNAKASSITDMVKKLAEKELITYTKYKGCDLSKRGEKIAKQIIRKHRLWETFLVNKLNFGWEEVHDIAEQLEHIHSLKLTDQLDEFLGFPKFDPHGDPIPDKNGNITYLESKFLLEEAALNSIVSVVKVNEDSISLLKYLDQLNLKLGSKIKILEQFPFDGSIKVSVDEQDEINLSKKVAESIDVQFLSKS